MKLGNNGGASPEHPFLASHAARSEPVPHSDTGVVDVALVTRGERGASNHRPHRVRDKPVIVGDGTPKPDESSSDSTAVSTIAPPESEVRLPVEFAKVQEAYGEAMRSFQELRKLVGETYEFAGRLNVERYEALRELSELKGLPPPERPPDLPELREVRRSVRRLHGRPGATAEELINEAELRAIARRRQFTVLGVILSIGLVVFMHQYFGWNWFSNGFGRDALMQMAGVGVFIQILFMGMLLFRVTTLTSRGRRWLFPTIEVEAHKRRTKARRGW